MANAARHLDMAADFPQLALGDGQPQARAFPRSFGGKERLKDAGDLFWVDAGAGVADFYGDAFLLGADAYLQAAALGHGLEGVADDIDVNVLKHVAVYEHGWHRLELSLNRDAEVLGVFSLQVEQLLQYLGCI